MRIKNTYWRDVFFQISGNTVAQIIGIIMLPILTRLYTPELFAMQALFIQITTLLVAFTTFRFEYFLQLLDNIRQSYSFILFIIYIGLIMTLAFTLGLYIIREANLLYYFNIEISNIFYLAPVTAFFVCLATTVQHEAERQADFKATSISAVGSKLSYSFSGIAMAFILNNIGLILTTLFGALGRIIFLWKYAFLFFKNIRNVSLDIDLILKYINRSKGLVISNTILSFSALLPMLFISKQYGVAFLGYFSLVMATIFLPSGLIGNAVGSVFYQKSAQLWNLKYYEELKKLWWETLQKLLIFALPVYFIICLVSPWVYPFIFGDNWLQAGKIAQLMSLVAFFSFLAGPLDRLSLVMGVAYYLPLIHFLRLIMVALTIFVAYFFNFNDLGFIYLFSINMSILYFIDIVGCRFCVLRRQINYE